MASSTFATGVPGPHATGRPTQQHLGRAANAGKWLHCYFTSTATLQVDYFTNFGDTPTSAGSLALGLNHNSEGYNLSVEDLNESSTDAFHIAISFVNASNFHITYAVRCTFNGTSVTFGSLTQVGSTPSTSATGLGIDGPCVGIDSGNKIYHGTGWFDEGATGWGDIDAGRFPNADNSGASWTVGTIALDKDISASLLATNPASSHYMCSLGSSKILYLADDGNNATFGQAGQILSFVYNSGWGGNNNVLASSTTFNTNGWGAVARTTGDVHVLVQSGVNNSTFTHRRTSNGTTWSAGDTVPTLNSQAGVALATDGTNVWCFAIDSSGNVKYVKWVSGTGWGSWTTLESATSSPASIQAYPTAVNSNLSVYWTEGSSSYNVVGEQLPLSTSHALAANITSGASVTGQLTVKHPLAASATSGASVTAQLTVKHALAASALSGASVTGALTWHHALKASATSGASVSAALTVQHKLAAGITSGASVSGALTVKHPLATSATSGASVAGQLTITHPLQASATSGASVSGALTVVGASHHLTASVTSGASVSGALTVRHALQVSVLAGAAVQAALTIHHPLSASALSGASASGVLTTRLPGPQVVPAGTASAAVVPQGTAKGRPF